jgi:ribose transport system permease protein
VSVWGVKTFCFVVTSVLAAVSAFILIARLNSGQNNAGFGFELQVIGAVLLGGASLAGGQGDPRRHPPGRAPPRHAEQRDHPARIDSSWQLAVNGLIILVAVLLDARRRRALGQE